VEFCYKKNRGISIFSAFKKQNKNKRMLESNSGGNGVTCDVAGLTSDEVLARHRKKYEADREWIQQQTELLRQLRPGTAAAPASHPPPSIYGAAASNSSPTPRPAAVRSARDHQQQQQFLAPGQGYRAASGYRVAGSALTVHTRASQWQKRRSQKLEELRQQQLEQDFVECTFHPAIAATDSSSANGGSARRSRLGGSPDFNSEGRVTEPAAISGLEDFLQRQERARQLVLEKAERLRCDGSKWRLEATQPEPFKLGVRVAGGPRIRSLAPPADASASYAELQPRGGGALLQSSHSPPRSSAQTSPLDQCSIPQGAFSAAISSPGASFRVF
jgi:hypothetical protein